jgi:hypothetical protein
MLQWYSKKKQSKGRGISGRVIAFAPLHEEQGRKTLHSHWQIWVEELLPQVCEDFWNTDHKIRGKKRKEFYCYVDEVMNATYSTKLNFSHKCKESEGTYDSSGNEDCGKNVGCKDFPISSDQVNSQRTDYIAIPVSKQNSEE